MVTTLSATTTELPGLIEGLPNICGWEDEMEQAIAHPEPAFLSRTNLSLSDISAGFAVALHMHQPTIPAGQNGELISNLQHMFEHPNDGDNHNAGAFAYCYSRVGDFIPELVEQGCNPRVMLDYAGTLLWGFQQMGREDILDKLRLVTCEEKYQPHVEWLGTFWGHGVAASVPLPDMKLHIQAWQHHFASLFGMEALKRVRGFSLPEMQLPNHPETLYVLVKALKDCGYQWMMVQEHTIETLTGEGVSNPHTPHRLVAKSSAGEVAEITVLIKTQGSDTKLVGQMQPYYEAKTRRPISLGEKQVPPLVTQIADGENGGVMMNEFPSAFKRAWHEMGNSRKGTVAFNGTEYLELLAADGVEEKDFPGCRAVGQARLWDAVGAEVTTEKVEGAIAQLKETSNIDMSGGSWTNDRSWVEGYSNVLEPMENLSYQFHEATDSLVQSDSSVRQQHRYRNALLHNMLLQTSCFRYWGQGSWTEYAKEIYRRGLAIVESDF